jgi:hypothetical protein
VTARKIGLQRPTLADLLVGCTIDQVLGPDEDGYVRLVAHNGPQRILIDVQSDPEGNGPGTLAVLNGTAQFITQGGGR